MRKRVKGTTPAPYTCFCKRRQDCGFVLKSERCNFLLLFSGETALHWCTKYGSVEVGKFLLESKADVDATNNWCDTHGAPHAHAFENEGAFIVVLKVVT